MTYEIQLQLHFATICAIARKLNISPEELADMSWGMGVGGLSANENYVKQVSARLDQLYNLNENLLKAIQI